MDLLGFEWGLIHEEDGRAEKGLTQAGVVVEERSSCRAKKVLDEERIVDVR
jgi:hypothetical protein